MNQKQRLAFFLSLLLCISVFFSYSFVALETKHDCIDDQCQVCLELQQCHAFIRIVTYTAFVGLSFFFVRQIFVLLHSRYSAPFINSSLVSLKVELLN